MVGGKNRAEFNHAGFRFQGMRNKSALNYLSDDLNSCRSLYFGVIMLRLIYGPRSRAFLFTLDNKELLQSI